MGLDITAYSHLEPVGAHTEGWCENEDHVAAYAYDSFPDSYRGLPDLGREYGTDGNDLIIGGCFELTDKTETIRFRAGSYSGYIRWRRDLASSVGLPDGRGYPSDAPFYELVWFADNEGTIGPEAAADLLADFREQEAAYGARQAAGIGGYPHQARYCELYVQWTRAFELASQSGLVSFH